MNNLSAADRTKRANGYTLLASSAAELAVDGAAPGIQPSLEEESFEDSLIDDSGRAAGEGGSQDLRLNVFREVLLTAWDPHPPRYYEARPTHFPPEVDVFLTGGLYMFVHRAMVEFFAHYNRAYIFVFLPVLGVFSVLSWNSILSRESASGERSFQFGTFFFCCAGLYLLCNAFSWLVTRPAVGRLHDAMDALAQDLSPLFRDVGYDLEYHRSGHSAADSQQVPCSSLWSRLATLRSSWDQESFVRIIPFRGVMTPEDRSRAMELLDPMNRVSAVAAPSPLPSPASSTESAEGGIRVAVYGAFLRRGLGRELNFLTTGSFGRVQGRLDALTWGAVATEMRPYTEKYRHAWSRLVWLGLALSQLPVWMPGAFSSWYVTGPYVALVAGWFVTLLNGVGLETWFLTRVHGPKTLFHDMQASVRRLSPLVEERAGYRIRFEMEPVGFLGGSVAYVCFERRDGEPFCR
jgi:hypothetical protein